MSWWWAFAALAPVVMVTVAECFSLQATPAWRAGASYLSAIMLLTPLISILGARRPGADAWPWFVVLPMILVLLWPVIPQLLQGSSRESLEIGTPAMIGVLLITMMGAGNFFGTGHTSAVLVFVVAVVLYLLPVSGWLPAKACPHPVWPATLLAVASVLVAERIQFLETQILAATDLRQQADRVWYLFRDLYGIVWSKRVMDRINQFVPREKWTVQLTLDGFASAADYRVSATTADSLQDSTSESSAAEPADIADELLQRPLEIMCWVMKRFASEDWLYQRLKVNPTVIVSESGETSSEQVNKTS